jgi:hypothetical protein
MYTIMENLITNKFYTNKEEALQKLNVFYAFKVLNDDDYTKLMTLTTDKYPETSSTSTTQL